MLSLFTSIDYTTLISMTRALLFIICLFTLTSCLEVKFTESQPNKLSGLAYFPEELAGKYINQDGDTLIIKGKYLFLANRKSKCASLFEQDSISNTILLKKWKSYYFLNLYEDDFWTVVLAERNDAGTLTVSLIDGESDETISNINTVHTLDTLFTDEGEVIHYSLTPSHKELSKLIELGIFSDQYFFEKLPD